MNAPRCNPSQMASQAMLGPLAVFVVVLLVGGVAYWQHQFDGLFAASTALLACLFGVLAGRLMGMLVPRSCTNSQWVLFNMLLRMAIPLAVCIVALLNRSPFLQFGFAYYLLVFYQLTLAIDVYGSIARLKQSLAH